MISQMDTQLVDNNFIGIKDQGQKLPHDSRTSNINSSQQPFCTFGIIELEFSDPKCTVNGTAFIINNCLLMTSAHLFFSKTSKKSPERITFYPEFPRKSNKQRHQIKVKSYEIDQRYKDQKNINFIKYDFALVELYDNDIISKQINVKIDWDYCYWDQPINIISINGYVFRQQINQYQLKHQQIVLVKKNDKQFFFTQDAVLLYKHTTEKGYSGAPVFIKRLNQKGLVKFSVIGVHKGEIDKDNYAVLLNQLKQAYNQMIQRLNLPANKIPHDYELSHKRRKQLLHNSQIKNKKLSEQLSLSKQDNAILTLKLNKTQAVLNLKIKKISRQLEYILIACNQYKQAIQRENQIFEKNIYQTSIDDSFSNQLLQSDINQHFQLNAISSINEIESNIPYSNKDCIFQNVLRNQSQISPLKIKNVYKSKEKNDFRSLTPRNKMHNRNNSFLEYNQPKINTNGFQCNCSVSNQPQQKRINHFFMSPNSKRLNFNKNNKSLSINKKQFFQNKITKEQCSNSVVQMKIQLKQKQKHQNYQQNAEQSYLKLDTKSEKHNLTLPLMNENENENENKNEKDLILLQPVDNKYPIINQQCIQPTSFNIILNIQSIINKKNGQNFVTDMQLQFKQKINIKYYKDPKTQNITLNFSDMLLKIKSFLQYQWKDLYQINLYNCQIDDMKLFLINGNLFPSLKILNLGKIQTGQIHEDDFDKFESLIEVNFKETSLKYYKVKSKSSSFRFVFKKKT